MTIATSAEDRPPPATPRNLIATAKRLGDASAYFVRAGDGWQSRSWRQFLEEVRTAACALVALGVQPGERICILGGNRPQWLIMDHAAMMIGAVGAGIYWTSAAPEVEYILGHSQAPLVLLETAAQADQVAGRRNATPALRYLIAMEGVPGPGAMAWGDFLALGSQPDAPALRAEVDRRLAAIEPQHLGALIYTSGTTGHPKAVMLTHGNLAWVADTLVKLLAMHEHDRQLSYLPMAHIAERVMTTHAPARGGTAVYFSRGMEQLLDDLREVRPTIFFGVPRVWEKMRAALGAKLAAASGAKGHLVRWATTVARRCHESALEGKAAGAALELQLALARRLMLRKIQAALGLDAARLLLSGAAPIATEHLRFFLGVDLVVRELYGQSEDCGPTTVSTPGATRIGAVGKALPGLQLRIGADGEILVRSPSVFAGYLGQPEATADTIHDGWLHSGDLGRLDADGFLYITGRKKDLIITSGGKNISPANLEADLMDCALIEYAVVVGEGRHFLSALLTLKPDAVRSFAATNGIAPEGLLRDPALLAALQEQIDVVNARHARVAAIRRYAVIEGNFSIGGYLTATMKLRRQAVIDAHRDVVDAMYRQA
jgi:long-chain acyl-CoA synthetase